MNNAFVSRLLKDLYALCVQCSTFYALSLTVRFTLLSCLTILDFLFVFFMIAVAQVLFGCGSTVCACVTCEILIGRRYLHINIALLCLTVPAFAALILGKRRWIERCVMLYEMQCCYKNGNQPKPERRRSKLGHNMLSKFMSPNYGSVHLNRTSNRRL